MFMATVTQDSPLRVLEDGATSDTAATVLGRADAWAPAEGDRVLVVRDGSRLIVLGEA